LIHRLKTKPQPLLRAGAAAPSFGQAGSRIYVVGAIGAATLLQRYGTLEAALTAGRFPAQAENFRL
jgi:hypothetical protein